MNVQLRLHILNPSTRSHASEGENRARNHRRKRGPLELYIFIIENVLYLELRVCWSLYSQDNLCCLMLK
jgi:hypothetical protein